MTDLTRGAYSGQFGFLYVESNSEPGNYDQEVFLAAHHWEPSIIHRGEPNNDWNVDYKSASLKWQDFRLRRAPSSPPGTKGPLPSAERRRYAGS